MSKIKKILKNITALYLAKFLSLFFGLILSIMIARILGDESFGQYSFIIAFTSIFAILSGLGYDMLIVKELARNKNKTNKYLGNVITIRFLLSIIIFISFIIITCIFKLPTEIKSILYLFGAYNFLIYFAKIFQAVFQAYEKMEYILFINIIIHSIRAASGIFILLNGFGLFILGLVFLFSGIFEVLLSFIICYKKFSRPKIEFNYKFMKKSLKVAIPIGLTSIFSIIFIKIDTLMLTLFKSDAVVGWYNAAYNLTINFTFFPNLFMEALFPSIALFFITSKESLKIAFEKSFKYLFIIGLPLTTGITLLSDKIILIIYGEQFFNSIIALQILSWDILLIFLYRCMYYLLISAEKQNKITLISGFCVFFNIGLNIILIPSFSYIGAGIATIFTESIILISFFYLIRKNIFQIQLKNILIKPILANFMMGFIIYQLDNYNIFLVIILSIFVYFIFLYLIRGISKDDIQIIKEIIPKRKKQK